MHNLHCLWRKLNIKVSQALRTLWCFYFSNQMSMTQRLASPCFTLEFRFLFFFCLCFEEIQRSRQCVAVQFSIHIYLLWSLLNLKVSFSFRTSNCANFSIDFLSMIRFSNSWEREAFAQNDRMRNHLLTDWKCLCGDALSIHLWAMRNALDVVLLLRLMLFGCLVFWGALAKCHCHGRAKCRWRHRKKKQRTYCKC